MNWKASDEETPLLNRARGLLFIAISDTIRATLWIQDKVKRWAKR